MMIPGIIAVSTYFLHIKLPIQYNTLRKVQPMGMKFTAHTTENDWS